MHVLITVRMIDMLYTVVSKYLRLLYCVVILINT